MMDSFANTIMQPSLHYSFTRHPPSLWGFKHATPCLMKRGHGRVVGGWRVPGPGTGAVGGPGQCIK